MDVLEESMSRTRTFEQITPSPSVFHTPELSSQAAVDVRAALDLIEECISDLGDEKQALDRLSFASGWQPK